MQRKSGLHYGKQFYSIVKRDLKNAQYGVMANKKSYRFIKGDIVNHQYAAAIEIRFSPHEIKLKPPLVYCNESWLRRDRDWHCIDCSGETASLCWVLPDEWKRAHNHKLKRLTLVRKEGAEWLLNNVKKLLEIHWVGYKLGIKHWREEWNGWSHDSDGSAEYIQEIEELGNPKNWNKV